MTPAPELPQGVPAGRVWLPVDGPESARAALACLARLRREAPGAPPAAEKDNI